MVGRSKQEEEVGDDIRGTGLGLGHGQQCELHSKSEGGAREVLSRGLP